MRIRLQEYFQKYSQLQFYMQPEYLNSIFTPEFTDENVLLNIQNLVVILDSFGLQISNFQIGKISSQERKQAQFTPTDQYLRQLCERLYFCGLSPIASGVALYYNRIKAKNSEPRDKYIDIDKARNQPKGEANLIKNKEIMDKLNSLKINEVLEYRIGAVIETNANQSMQVEAQLKNCRSTNQSNFFEQQPGNPFNRNILEEQNKIQQNIEQSIHSSQRSSQLSIQQEYKQQQSINAQDSLWKGQPQQPITQPFSEPNQKLNSDSSSQFPHSPQYNERINNSNFESCQIESQKSSIDMKASSEDLENDSAIACRKNKNSNKQVTSFDQEENYFLKDLKKSLLDNTSKKDLNSKVNLYQAPKPFKESSRVNQNSSQNQLTQQQNSTTVVSCLITGENKENNNFGHFLIPVKTCNQDNPDDRKLNQLLSQDQKQREQQISLNENKLNNGSQLIFLQQQKQQQQQVQPFEIGFMSYGNLMSNSQEKQQSLPSDNISQQINFQIQYGFLQQQYPKLQQPQSDQQFLFQKQQQQQLSQFSQSLQQPQNAPLQQQILNLLENNDVQELIFNNSQQNQQILSNPQKNYNFQQEQFNFNKNPYNQQQEFQIEGIDTNIPQNQFQFLTTDNDFQQETQIYQLSDLQPIPQQKEAAFSPQSEVIIEEQDVEDKEQNNQNLYWKNYFDQNSNSHYLVNQQNYLNQTFGSPKLKQSHEVNKDNFQDYSKQFQSNLIPSYPNQNQFQILVDNNDVLPQINQQQTCLSQQFNPQKSASSVFSYNNESGSQQMSNLSPYQDSSLFNQSCSPHSQISLSQDKFQIKYLQLDMSSPGYVQIPQVMVPLQQSQQIQVQVDDNQQQKVRVNNKRKHGSFSEEDDEEDEGTCHKKIKNNIVFSSDYINNEQQNNNNKDIQLSLNTMPYQFNDNKNTNFSSQQQQINQFNSIGFNFMNQENQSQRQMNAFQQIQQQIQPFTQLQVQQNNEALQPNGIQQQEKQAIIQQTANQISKKVFKKKSKNKEVINALKKNPINLQIQSNSRKLQKSNSQNEDITNKHDLRKSKKIHKNLNELDTILNIQDENVNTLLLNKESKFSENQNKNKQAQVQQFKQQQSSSSQLNQFYNFNPQYLQQQQLYNVQQASQIRDPQAIYQQVQQNEPFVQQISSIKEQQDIPQVRYELVSLENENLTNIQKVGNEVRQEENIPNVGQQIQQVGQYQQISQIRDEEKMMLARLVQNPQFIEQQQQNEFQIQENPQIIQQQEIFNARQQEEIPNATQSIQQVGQYQLISQIRDVEVVMQAIRQQIPQASGQQQENELQNQENPQIVQQQEDNNARQEHVLLLIHQQQQLGDIQEQETRQIGQQQETIVTKEMQQNSMFGGQQQQNDFQIQETLQMEQQKANAQEIEQQLQPQNLQQNQCERKIQQQQQEPYFIKEIPQFQPNNNQSIGKKQSDNDLQTEINFKISGNLNNQRTQKYELPKQEIQMYKHKELINSTAKDIYNAFRTKLIRGLELIKKNSNSLQKEGFFKIKNKNTKPYELVSLPFSGSEMQIEQLNHNIFFLQEKAQFDSFKFKNDYESFLHKNNNMYDNDDDRHYFSDNPLKMDDRNPVISQNDTTNPQSQFCKGLNKKKQLINANSDLQDNYSSILESLKNSNSKLQKISDTVILNDKFQLKLYTKNSQKHKKQILSELMNNLSSNPNIEEKLENNQNLSSLINFQKKEENKKPINCIRPIKVIQNTLNQLETDSKILILAALIIIFMKIFY